MCMSTKVIGAHSHTHVHQFGLLRMCVHGKTVCNSYSI